MKQPIILLSFILFLSGTVSASDDNKRLEFLVKEISKDKINCASIKLELKNLTEDTLTFVINKCYGLLIKTDCDSVFNDPSPCKARIPGFIKIAPHDNFQQSVFIKTKRANSSFPDFRIGVNLIEPKEKNNPYKASQEKDSKKETIYSNYIQIK